MLAAISLNTYSGVPFLKVSHLGFNVYQKFESLYCLKYSKRFDNIKIRMNIVRGN